MVLLLVTWTLLDWIYLKTPSELRANSDWTVLVLAVYPGLAGFVTWHRSKFRPLGWRIGLTVLSVFSFCVIAAGLLLTLGLEIHFWLGGSV
jgi:CHASE2 domain-containing sensor protein